ncbi:MAG: hypothetical protein HY331_05260 [Chloroflexi bacterium]|nr:hypothetical protein [Chloroflexota bacterium]
MVTITRESVREEMHQLVRRVEAVIEASPAPLLEAVHVVLNQATAAIEAMHPHGAHAVEIAPALRQQYFPVTAPAHRTVSPHELREAEARWDAALERGRRYRAEAIAWLGPALAPGEVAERLGVSTVTVSNWRRHNKLLGVRFDEHQYLYPSFQFVESPDQGERGVLRHLDEILAILGERPAWEKAKFFLTAAPSLGGRTPLALLRIGTPSSIARVRDLAEQAGEMGF